MNIMHVTENLDNRFGGPTRSIPYLAHYLSKYNISSNLYSVQLFDHEANETIEKYKLCWIKCKCILSKKLRYSPELQKQLFEGVDRFVNSELILHSHNLWNYPSYITFKIAVKKRVPYVVSLRGTIFDWSLNQRKVRKKIALKVYQKEMLQHAEFIHVTSEEEFAALRSLGVSTPAAIIPNAVDVDEFIFAHSKEIAKERLNLEGEKKYVLFLSRIHPKKGLEYLVDAWIETCAYNSNWDLLIAGPIGDASYYKEICKKIRINNLESRCRYLGMLDGQDRLDAYLASDGFVLPTHTENFGIVIAEALAAKLPVITTHGAPWRAIEEYSAGWWVETPEDVRDAYSELVKLNDYERKRLGSNGYELVSDLYSWDRTAVQMKQAYEWIFNKNYRPEFMRFD